MARYPNKRLEKSLFKKGFKFIAGVDEAGKGSWAGPLVAAAVILDPTKKISGIKDSKLLRASQRAELYQKITTSALAWAAAVVDHTIIDAHGIVAAQKSALKGAVESLSVAPDFVILDAVPIDFGKTPSQAVIDGDYKITSVAAASIIAKVTRDRLMDTLDEQFGAYGFKQHKGYGTAHHFQMIMQYGVSGIHRRSFRPMVDLINE